jgi:AraC family transcriptional regulator
MIREQRQVRYWDSGARCAALRVVFQSDPPGIAEALVPTTVIAVHVGTPVRMQCRHGDERHAGLAIHGDIDIIPSGMPARWEMRETDTALVLALDADYLRRVAHECAGKVDGVEVRSRFQIRDPQIEHIAWALKAEAEQDYPGGPLYLESMARALSVQLLRRHTAHAMEDRPAAHRRLPPSEMREALAYIEANIAGDIRVPHVARAANRSASHLEVLFRQATGMPVHQYVIRRRVDRAVLLLKHSSLPISEVALQSGFAHQSHLALHVRRILGVSPTRIRGRGA